MDCQEIDSCGTLKNINYSGFIDLGRRSNFNLREFNMKNLQKLNSISNASIGKRMLCA